MKVFLKAIDKLKRQPVCNNPTESDLICKYNKGWNDAIAKVEELITSYSLLDMWIPVDVKLPPEPEGDTELYDLPEYIVTIKGAELPTSLTYIGDGRFADMLSERALEYPVIAWMPMPEVYKEKRHE